MSFDIFYGPFNSFDNPRLSSLQARELISHLPVTFDGLEMYNTKYEDGKGAIDGMIEWVGKAKSLRRLDCIFCQVGGDAKGGRDAGSRLAKAMASNHAQSIEYLRLYCTDLVGSGNASEWASGLEKMTELKTLLLYGADMSDEEKSALSNATHASEIKVE